SGLRTLNRGMTDVVPEPRLINKTIGSVVRQTSERLGRSSGTSARNCASSSPWVRMAALGVPVLPVVKVMRALSEERVRARAVLAGSFFAESPIQIGIFRNAGDSRDSNLTLRLATSPLHFATSQQASRRFLF